MVRVNPWAPGGPNVPCRGLPPRLICGLPSQSVTHPTSIGGPPVTCLSDPMQAVDDMDVVPASGN